MTIQEHEATIQELGKQLVAEKSQTKRKRLGFAIGREMRHIWMLKQEAQQQSN